jgi:hypothetical protein
MGIASIILNVLSVLSLPMVLAVGVMTTDSPSTSKRHFSILKWTLAVHLGVVIASIAVSWWLRTSSRPGLALAASLSPGMWIVLVFAGVALSGSFSGPKSGSGGASPQAPS